MRTDYIDMTKHEMIFHIQCDLITSAGHAELNKIRTLIGPTFEEKMKMMLEVNDRVVKAMDKANEEMKQSIADELVNKHPN